MRTMTLSEINEMAEAQGAEPNTESDIGKYLIVQDGVGLLTNAYDTPEAAMDAWGAGDATMDDVVRILA